MSHKRQPKFIKVEDARQNLEEEREIEAPRALLNDIVLETIFKYLGYKDLKSCRNVGNITWLRNSKKAWWRHTKVVIKNRCAMAKKVRDYLTQTEMTANATVYKFENYDETYPVDFKAFTTFWEYVGHCIKSLEIQYAAFKSVDSFRQFAYTRCPNLEKLIIKSYHYTTYGQLLEPMKWETPRFGQQTNLKFLKIDFSRLPVSWMELLSHFPNLQSLEAKDQNVDIYRVISIIRQHDPSILKLKHIDIKLTSKRDQDHSVCSVLLDPNLSLEKICIDLAVYEPETYLDILDFHAHSLTELVIRGDGGYTNQRLPRQPLNTLEKLIVSGHYLPVEFFNYTPNVKRVQVPNIGNLSSTQSHVRLDSCKELALSFISWEGQSSPELAFFFNVCPNLQVLETVALSNLEFSMICERWTKLVSIKVTLGSRVDIVGLLGFDPDSKPKNGIRSPNITNLKDLQTVSMISVMFIGNSRRVEIKNAVAIRNELERLPHLKKFELIGYKLNRSPIWKRLFTKYSG